MVVQQHSPSVPTSLLTLSLLGLPAFAGGTRSLFGFVDGLGVFQDGQFQLCIRDI